jgi:hypothetical protein
VVTEVEVASKHAGWGYVRFRKSLRVVLLWVFLLVVSAYAFGVLTASWLWPAVRR